MPATRQELTSLITQYLDGVAARDPTHLPTTPDVRYTENCQALALGKGLWATATGLGGYRLDMCDAQSGNAAVFAIVEEMGNPAIVATRLKADGGRVSEVETLVARFGNPIFMPEAMIAPRSEYLEAVPEGERSSRDELQRCADLYFSGIEQNNGKMIPVAEECYRFENGVRTTGNTERHSVSRMGVAEGIGSGFFTYIPEIRDRRYPVLDEERGLALGIVYFEHPGNVKSVDVPGHGVMEMAPFTQKPSTAMIVELFKVRGGQIRAIDAVLEFLPYGVKSGWD